VARIVLAPHASGLGDHLIYTTLPELFARRGDEVYVTAGIPGFRNPEVRELVWGRNPFVSGFVDEPPNAGVQTISAEFIGAAKHHPSSIAAIEALHGFTPSGQLPRVYYQPRFRPEFRTLSLADPRSISQPMKPEAFEAFVDHHARWQGFDRRHVVVLQSQYSGPHGEGALSQNPRQQVQNIFEYADLIYSCRRFLVAESGGQVLAAAIRGTNAAPEVFALFTTYALNDELFTCPNVRYSATGSMTPDYLIYPR
jgi:hypothetical protein